MALDFISNIQNHTPFIGIVLGVVCKSYSHKELKFPFMFLLGSYLINVLVGVFEVIFIKGVFIISVFAIFYVVLLTWMYYRFSKGVKNFLYIGVLAFITVFTTQFIYVDSRGFPLYMASDNVFAVVLGFMYFLYVYRTEQDIDFRKNLGFLIASIFLIYDAGGFFVQFMIDYVISNEGENAHFYSIQLYLSIACYLGFAWLFWKTRKSEQIAHT